MIVALDFIIADESCSARPGEDSGHLPAKEKCTLGGVKNLMSLKIHH